MLPIIRKMTKEFVTKDYLAPAIEDFEYRAIDRWQYVSGRGNYPNATSWRDIYDESKFQEALDRMIHKHDASHGISWETVDFWLDKICLKPEEDEE